MVNWTRIRHRVIQFFRALGAPLFPVDAAYAAQHLSPNLLRLFNIMDRAERQHAIMVCRKLEAQGYGDADLLCAALLHDVGKTVSPPYLWERIFVVLVEFLKPRLAAQLSRGELKGMRRAFVIRRMHTEWGAALAEQAGASRRTCELIRRHHEVLGEAQSAEDIGLAVLQAIDDG